MEYDCENMKRIYFVTLIEVILILIVVCIYIYNTIKRQGNIVGDRPFGSFGENFFTDYCLPVNIIMHCVIIAGLVGLLYSYCIPVLMDFPAALNDDYIENSGYVIRWSCYQENTNKLRIIEITDENDNNITLHVYGYGLHKGDYVTVRYYEHSHYGMVIYD